MFLRDESLSTEPTMAQFIDADIHHSATMTLPPAHRQQVLVFEEERFELPFEWLQSNSKCKCICIFPKTNSHGKG